MDPRRVVIMGAAGRDFHDFNVVYRDDPGVKVVAFTATQIPGIANRRYPPELAGPLYADGIPIRPEAISRRSSGTSTSTRVVFAYSDVSHETVMHAASRVLAAGADFELLGPERTMLRSRRPVVAVGATRTGAGKSQTTRYLAALLAERGHHAGRRPPSDAVRRPRRPARSSATPPTTISIGTTPRSRSARSTSRISTPGGSSTRASTTRRSCARRSSRPTSSCGTAATTTSRSTGRTCTSSSPIRSGRATSGATTRARRTCGWPTSSSSTRSTRRILSAVEAVRRSIEDLNPRAAVV